MGWSVSGAAYSNVQSTYATLQSQRKQRELDFAALTQALNSGDLGAAKTAYAKLKTELPSKVTNDPKSSFSKIGDALDKGDIAGAKAALPQPADAAQKSGRAPEGGGERENDGDGDDGATASVSATSPNATQAGIAATSRAIQKTTVSGPATQLANAITSGNTPDARAAMKSILDELTQLSSFQSSGSLSKNTPLSAGSQAASALLQNPHFKALQDAVASGDTNTMKLAWTDLINSAAEPDTSASTLPEPVTA